VSDYLGVIGIDPSLTGTGIATYSGTATIHGEGDQRLKAIYKAIHTAATPFLRRPGLDPLRTLAVIEDLPTHGQGAGKTGMAQGVVRLALIDAGADYVLLTPATLKKFATGKGNATKPDMRMALYKRAGLDLRDDNQVDAWWLRQAGLYATGHDAALTLPRAQREVLLKVAWPEDVAARLLEPYERVVADV